MGVQPPKSGRRFAGVLNTCGIAGTGVQAPGLSGPGATSSFAYAQTLFGGTYEAINNANSTVSGPITNPNFPTYGQTYFNLGVDGTVITQIINTSALMTASASPGMWNHTTSTPFGGLHISGHFNTSTVGEKFWPVASTISAGIWVLPNGTMFSPGTFFTGQQQYQIMQQPGPWPAGSGANTSATIGMEMLPVWADLGAILQAQGAHSLESFTDNWNTVPGL